MVRMGSWENERLSRVVERYQFHSSKVGAANPVIADAAKTMCDIDICEMWMLTQK